MLPWNAASPWRNLAGILAINTVIGLVLFALLHSWRVRGGEDLFAVLARSQIFAHSIGGLCGLLIPPVAVRLGGSRPWLLWPVYVAYLIAVAAAGTLLACAVNVWFGLFPSGSTLRMFQAHIGFTTLIALCIGIASFLIGRLQYRQSRTAIALKDQQLARQEAERLAAEAQLESLQSRLQPHFLFNTINSILSLIREDPAAAEQMLERLSRLLRFALETRGRGMAPLGEELKLVSDYLLIEQARFGRRLVFSIDAGQAPAEAGIPPFSLQTLVENSMKYAVAARREGGTISVRARASNGAMELEVEDDGPGFSRSQIVPGHGLDVLERRIALVYGGEGRLEIGGRGSGAVVRLLLPVRALAGQPQ